MEVMGYYRSNFWPLSAMIAQCTYSEEEGKLLSEDENKIFDA